MLAVSWWCEICLVYKIQFRILWQRWSTWWFRY